MGSANQQYVEGIPGYDGSEVLGDDVGDASDDIDDEEDEDEHIIVTMLKSMNSKKLETR